MISFTDPERLKRAHVVITSYSIVANEYAAYGGEAKDESKSKKSKKAAESDDSDDSESDSFARKKKAAGRASKKKDALFNVKWWRIVLGV